MNHDVANDGLYSYLAGISMCIKCTVYYQDVEFSFL
jgi:hypothetical protein